MFGYNSSNGGVTVTLNGTPMPVQNATYTVSGTGPGYWSVGNSLGGSGVSGTALPGTTTPLTGVYQHGGIVLDDKQAMEQLREHMERQAQEELEATDRLYELLEGLRARCEEDWEVWD